MAQQNRTLQLMASKLGLREEEDVLSKAAEFERLLQTKSSVNNIPDTAKIVICLDLAASHFRVDVDLKTAIKCSGLKGPTYNNSRKIVENLLDLNNDKLTVSQLCLTLQCSVQELADKILQEFRSCSKMELDLSLPQYVCVAVYQACRISKIKVSKSKLLDKSQLKPAQWSKLEAEWTKFTDEKFATVVKKKRGRPAKNADIEEEKMDIDSEIVSKKDDEVQEIQEEPYEDWKRRILETAYKELSKLQTDKQITKHKDSAKKVENTNTHTENVNKHIESPNKHKRNEKKHNESVKISLFSPNKHKHNENKHNEIVNKQTNNPLVLLTDSFSPRRSPRKTPQKYEPYTSPVKNKGVRLLFPL